MIAEERSRMRHANKTHVGARGRRPIASSHGVLGVDADETKMMILVSLRTKLNTLAAEPMESGYGGGKRLWSCLECRKAKDRWNMLPAGERRSSNAASKKHASIGRPHRSG